MSELSTDADAASRPRWLLWLLGAAGAAWLAAAAGAIVAGAPPLQIGSAVLAWTLVIAGVSAPLIVILLLAVLLRPPPQRAVYGAQLHGEALAAAAAVRAEIADVDTRATAMAARLEALRGALAGDAQGLFESAARLESVAGQVTDASRNAAKSASALDVQLPAAAAQVAAIAAALDTSAATSRTQLGDIETLLAAVWDRHAEAQRAAEAAHATMADSMAAIDAASARTAAAVGERAAALDSAIGGATTRTAALLDTTRDGIAAHTAALLASVEAARTATDQIGGDAARAIGRRLDRLIEATAQLGEQLAAQDDRSRAMIEAAERSFMVLDAKLANAANTSNTALDALAGRTAAAREAIHQLGDPIGDTHAAILELESAVERLHGSGGAALTLLGTELPAAGSSLAGLGDDIRALHAGAAGIAAPVAASAAAIAAAGTAFAEQRAALDTAADKLITQLSAARTTVGEVESQTESGAIASAQRLIEVLGRVREVAAATAGTMRTTLDGVVAEAETALDRAGSEKAEAAFGAPVRASIAEIEDISVRAAAAAQAAAERVTQRLLGLTQTVAVVEARIDEADAHYDMRLRDDLAKRASMLLESLNTTSIDIAKFLRIDVDDNAWAAYLKGDRSIFARQTVRLIDGGTARAIARHYRHDAAFREQATRYIDEFEQLLKRVLPDREGKALAVTLLSSDVGKLYVALAQATERLR